MRWFGRSNNRTASTKNPSAAPANKGGDAEAIAQQYLRTQGLETLEKNYRTRAGEIDLIMKHNDVIVFIEVRLRTNKHYSSAAESVNLAKQTRLIKTAQAYLQMHNLLEKYPCRFDVIALDNDLHTASSIDWIQNAFSAD